MKKRMLKFVLSLALVLSLVPALSANAAMYATTSNVTSNSLTLGWTLESGEYAVQIYKNGAFFTSTAYTSTYPITGLSPCTTYYFDVKGMGSYGSTSTYPVTTLGCPSAPVISATATYNSINVSWSASNAVEYDLYVDGAFYTTTTSTSYSLSATPSRSYSIKVVARNATGQTAQATKGVSTPAFFQTYTQSLSAGNIVLSSGFTNTSSTSSTYIYFSLYRVSGSSSTYVGGTSAYLAPGQSSSLSTTLASGQPAGTYRVEASSTYAVVGGLSYYSM
ncbi:hypothetical protein [Paenibacillus sacheonensis]|uniref:Fibronectin type-III domain-containing protein n=1 Tax=Paenibacillus sacheonensis TaxID=742054 RepID=A0A7X4YUR3_9BACL|nr:hypothetical protein [Paenibacillus sacheonensis]MBM7567782.1 hypothetical protein [Paenibacillus sacheonensis]NBC71949.1 hypothetical protein [Paenibacillus sacheonensis]